MNRNVYISSLVVTVAGTALAAVDAAIGSREVGEIPVSLYVFFVGFVTVFLIVRVLWNSPNSRAQDVGKIKKVFRWVGLCLGVGSISYMAAFLIGFLAAGSTGARIVAEHILWFVGIGVFLGASMGSLSMLRKTGR